MKHLKTFISITLLMGFMIINVQGQVGLRMNQVKKTILLTPQNHVSKLNPHNLDLPKVYLYRLSKGGNNTIFNTRIESNLNRKFTAWERFLFDPPFSISLM
jgi:hypothetical protein